MPEKIDLSDLGLFAEGTPHEVFRRLRRESPIYWNEQSDGSGFWALTRHADVMQVSRDSETFGSERHGIMIYDESFETSGRERTMLEMDAPRHTRLRALVSRGMKPQKILELEEFARRRFAEELDRCLELGECDFVVDVACTLPVQVICEMMGVPESERRHLGLLANRIQGFDDPELGGGGGSENSDAIEEMIRWTTPIHHFRRTATRDTTIAGQPIREHDRVVVWYSSANRDELVFTEPFRFDIARAPNDHLAFGFGSHYCLGANLARLEMRIVFEALIERGIEVDCRGEVDYMLSSFTNSLKRMPVRLRADG